MSGYAAGPRFTVSPSYTRMVPAHHVVEIQLVGCPDPDPVYTRFFTPEMGNLPADLDAIGARYIGALADEIAQWSMPCRRRSQSACAFSGGIDSGSVFLTAYHVCWERGMHPGRLKAFVLDLGDGPMCSRHVPFSILWGSDYFWSRLKPIAAPLMCKRPFASSKTTSRSISNRPPWPSRSAVESANDIRNGNFSSMAMAAMKI